MAKLSMKNYEDFLQEEARQDRLQKELESKREFESLDSEEYWWDYQRKQEEDKRIDCYDDYDYDYFEDDYYEDDEDDGYGPEYDPCGPDGSLTADDLYDMYGYSAQYDEDCCQPENKDPWEDELDPFSDNPTGLIAQEADFPMWLNCLERKSVARNRHLNELKAKKRAKNSASILTRKCLRGDFRLPYEEYRLVTRATAAIKKANRVKSA